MRHLSLFLVLCLPAVLALLATATGTTSNKEPERHFVAFTFIGRVKVDTMKEEQIRWLNDSAFTGAGIEYVGQYVSERGPTLGDLSERVAFLNEQCTKDLWPTLYLNNMLGYDPDNGWLHPSAPPHASKVPRFRTFRGLDLDNAGGARENFEANWREALEIAKALDSPGLMLDFEAYNDKRASQVGGKRSLAESRGEAPEEVKEGIRSFGARLADITHETYPGATLFCFQTTLGHLDQANSVHAQLTVGMLERSKQKNYDLLILCGGELGLGYIHPNPEYMAQMIRRRAALAKPYLLTYPNLELTGVHAPFMDPERRAYWMTEDRIGPSIRTVEDMQPLYELLVKNYRSSWFYGANKAFYPYGPDSARFSKVWRAALTKAPYEPLDLEELGDEVPPTPLGPKVNTSGLNIAGAHAVAGAIPLVDWTDPDAHGVALRSHDKFPEANGVFAAAVPPGTDRKYAAELRVGRWEEGLDAYWHTVWTRVLIRDVTPYAGVALDVRNAGEHPGTFQLQISDHKGKNFHRSYGLMPGESFTIVLGIEEMTENMDTADLKAAQFVTGKRPETDLRFQMGPLVAIPRDQGSTESTAGDQRDGSAPERSR